MQGAPVKRHRIVGIKPWLAGSNFSEISVYAWPRIDRA
jgi:hypothetical protein